MQFLIRPLLRSFFRMAWFSLLLLNLHLNGASQPLNPLQSTSREWNSKVFSITDPQAVERFHPNVEVVYRMLNALLSASTGKADLVEAWKEYVAPDDVVGIKVLSDPGSVSGTRPAVVEAVVRSLLSTGFPKEQVVIWDRRKGLLVATGYDQLARRLGVSIAGSSDEGYDPEAFYEAPLVGNLVYGDHEFGQDGKGIGRKSYVSKLLTRKLTRIVQIHPMLNHYLGGVNGHVVGLATAGVDNNLRFTLDESRYHQAIPEICAMPELYDKLAFNLVDGLICQYQGEERGFLQYSTTRAELRLSTDPVALDVLSIKEINQQRKQAGLKQHASVMTLYRNASLLELGESDPSRIFLERLP